MVELVTVVIILSVLAAIAVPKYLELGKSARVASLKALVGTINTAATNMRAACKTQPACDYTLDYQYLDFNELGGGWKRAELNYGWLAAGDPAHPGIDAWVNQSGFTVTANNYVEAIFALDGAPDSTNCSVTYHTVYGLGPAAIPTVTVKTTGC